MSSMKRLMIISALLTLSCLPTAAQLNGSGFYRLRNYQNNTHYISLANNLFNYNTIIQVAGNGAKHLVDNFLLSLLKKADDYGVPAAMSCARQYLATDIKIVEDEDCVNPSTIVYLKRNGDTNQYDLMGQSTSLIGITTGSYTTPNIDISFKDLYATIEQKGTDGNNKLYTAKIALSGTGTVDVPVIGEETKAVTLETDYFYDNNGTFNIKKATNAGASNDAKWYIEPVTKINVKADAAWVGEDKIKRFYTTYFVPFAYTLGGNITNAYVVTGTNAEGVIEKTSIATNTNGVVPAGTPVILECLSNVPSENYIIPEAEEPLVGSNVENGTSDIRTTSNYSGTNLLKGAYFSNTDGTLYFDKYSGGEVGTKGTTTTDGASFDANNYIDPAKLSYGYVLGTTESGFLGMVKTSLSAMPANQAWMEYNGSENGYPLFTNVQSTPGDVNRDGDVNVGDITALVNIIHGRDKEEYNYDYEAADLDNNDVYNISDITSLINIIHGRNQ